MGKKKRTLHLKAVIDGAVICAELDKVRAMQEQLERAGLDKEARRYNSVIADLCRKREEKIEEANRQRLALVRHMLLAFSAGDIATTCADKMEEIFTELSFGDDADGGKALAKVFRMQATDWNRCVQLVDGMGDDGNQRVSMYYADLAEEIVSTVIPVMFQVIDKYMATKEGRKLL